MSNSILDDVTIDNKTIRELLPGDPLTDTDAAYQLLSLFTCLYPFPIPAPEATTYQQLETAIKRDYWAFITGVAPEHQTSKDIEYVTLLEALVFLRNISKEAEVITRAVNRVWEEQRARRRLSDENTEAIMKLYEQAKEWGSLSIQLLRIFRDLRDAR